MKSNELACDAFTGSDEYLYVARTASLDLGTRSREVDEQLNRIFVVRQIEFASDALSKEDRENSVALLQKAYDKIELSDSKGKLI